MSIPYIEATHQMLTDLNISVHRRGYQQLCVGIPRFALDNTQSLTKELYPYIASRFGNSDWQAVEHSIRLVLLEAWDSGNREVWEDYFPYCHRPPTNKQFIATLAERLKS